MQGRHDAPMQCVSTHTQHACKVCVHIYLVAFLNAALASYSPGLHSCIMMTKGTINNLWKRSLLHSIDCLTNGLMVATAREVVTACSSASSPVARGPGYVSVLTVL